jgi:hypothetical protein
MGDKVEGRFGRLVRISDQIEVSFSQDLFVCFPVFGIFHSFEEIIPGAEDGSRLSALPDGNVLPGEDQERE